MNTIKLRFYLPLLLLGVAALSPVLAQSAEPTAANPVQPAPAVPNPVQTAPAVANPTQTAPVAGDQPSAEDSMLEDTTPDISIDLWERIRRGFGMPNLQIDLVQDREQWYAKRPEYIQRMTARSSKYLYHIVDELERRNMPTELALLPFIESAFNPQAVSSARASGMWQFMPRTGKDFDLKQNAFRDDRRDVLASTRAALDYLQKLYAMFGDWHLALAAYNWGEGNVSKSIMRNQRQGASVAYTDLRMPAETRLYVPKLQAMKNVVANPQALGVNLPSIPNHPYFQSVRLPRDMDVALIARLAEVPIDDFKALNPSAHRPVMLAAGTPRILLPWDNAEIFLRNVDKYAGRLASWTAWVAPKTMKVAEVAKRVGMPEDELRSVNKIPPRMMIKAGSALLVPRSAKQQSDVSTKVADNGQLNLMPELVLRKQWIKARKHDTMAGIAKRYKVSVDQLAQWNGLSASSSLHNGQKLMVMVAGKAGKNRNTGSAKHARKKNKQ